MCSQIHNNVLTKKVHRNFWSPISLSLQWKVESCTITAKWPRRKHLSDESAAFIWKMRCQWLTNITICYISKFDKCDKYIWHLKNVHWNPYYLRDNNMIYTCAPFAKMLIPHGYVIPSIMKCEMKLLFHSQTLTVQPAKFGNARVISSHTLQGMWLKCTSEGFNTITKHQDPDFCLAWWKRVSSSWNWCM